MKCSYGKVELKDGGGPKNNKQIIIEVSTLGCAKGNEQWAYLTKSQALKLGNRLIKFGKKP